MIAVFTQNLMGEELCVVEVIDLAKNVLSFIPMPLSLTFLAAYVTFESKALLGSKVKCAVKKAECERAWGSGLGLLDSKVRYVVKKADDELDSSYRYYVWVTWKKQLH